MHPQQVAEKGAEIAHFRYVHHAIVLPVSLDWRVVDRVWHFIATQECVDRPAMAKSDAKAFHELRK